MLPKQTLLEILGALPDDKLFDALRGAGIDLGPMAPSVRSAVGGFEPTDEKLASWNATKVVVPRTKRPPIADTSRLYEEAAAEMGAPGVVRPYMTQDPLDEQIAPYAVAAGS